MGKKITLEEFENRIKEAHPFSKLEIIQYSTLKDGLIYSCKKCGKEHFQTQAEGVFSKTNPCDCEKNFYSRADKIRFFEAQQDKIEVVSIERTTTKLFCKNCKNFFTRTTVSTMASFNSCPYCDNGRKKQTNSKKEAEETLKRTFPEHEYQVLEYTNFHNKCKIKHLNCKFIYYGNFDSFLQSRGCPRCYRKISKGEQKIKDFLKNKNISFVQQKSLDLDPALKKYKFDFFLPNLNFAIEYDGEQHYKEKAGFFDSLKKTQQRDKIKEEYCLKYNIKLLRIPYWDLSNIEKILLKWFNDYPIGE